MDSAKTPHKYSFMHGKYSLDEKKEFGDLVIKFKKEYDAELASLKGATHWDSKRKKHVLPSQIKVT